MTCIIGIKDKTSGKVTLAGDTRAASSSEYIETLCKVFQVDDFIFASSGSPKVAQTIKYYWEPPVKAEGTSDEQYLFCDVIYSLKELITSHDEIKLIDASSLVLVYKNNMYEIEGSFAMYRHEEFVSIGSGMAYAYGFYEGSGRNVTHKNFLESAFAAVAKHSHHCSREFYELTLEGNKDE